MKKITFPEITTCPYQCWKIISILSKAAERSSEDRTVSLPLSMFNTIHCVFYEVPSQLNYIAYMHNLLL